MKRLQQKKRYCRRLLSLFLAAALIVQDGLPVLAGSLEREDCIDGIDYNRGLQCYVSEGCQYHGSTDNFKTRQCSGLGNRVNSNWHIWVADRMVSKWGTGFFPDYNSKSR